MPRQDHIPCPEPATTQAKDPAPTLPSPGTSASIASAIIAWHTANARDLPWRNAPAGERDPYRVLVSEIMLQQTQVARVVEKFGSFLARFPTIAHLAAADEADVLAEWSGLGYYRRARLLHAAAKSVIADHAGQIPSDHATLLSIPGIGRYTAGAIASIAFDQPQPIVDGNVARVVLRLEARAETPNDSKGLKQTWTRAESLVSAATAPGVFNEGLMELGATVCTPRNPRCLHCPIADHCRAHEQSRQDEIPLPKPAAKRKPLYITAILALDAKGRRLVEQRPESGLWAGMHQPPSLDRDDRFATPDELADRLGLTAGTILAEFDHQTTHRAVRFRVHLAESPRAGHGLTWHTKLSIQSLALGNPHRKILLDLTP